MNENEEVFKKPKPSILPSFEDAIDAKKRTSEETKHDFIPE